MTEDMYVPADLERVEWDVTVVGTGMGGATVGYELARLGHRVLFMEQGLFLHKALLGSSTDSSELPSRSIQAADVEGIDSPWNRLSRGLWPRRLQGRTSFGELEFFAPLGCGTGGSTSLYAAALERFAPADFQPKGNFPDVRDSTLPEAWPISYEELRPYYERAEALFRVRGSHDPLDRGGTPLLRVPPPLSSRDSHLQDSFRHLGLHPYRVHVAYDFVEGCAGCGTGPCVCACKNDAARVCLLPALEAYGAKLLTQCQAMRIDACDSRASSVQCRFKGRNFAVRSKVIVLAAGAYMTPALLLNSKSETWPHGLANRSGLVGRNLMFHASDYFAVRPLGRFSHQGLDKSLALNDFYQVDGKKLGTFQSAGVPVAVGRIMQYMRDLAETDPAWWRKLASPRPHWWRKASSPAVRLIAMAMYYVMNFKNAAVWASIIEDLPYHDNRIVADPDAANGMRFEYRYPDELKARVTEFRSLVAKALAPHRVMLLSGANNLNYGHVCGTCRFGSDPRASVLNRNNRAHDVTNLFVVDASFFPSSGGTNPSLTIAANALRVAESIHGMLGGSRE